MLADTHFNVGLAHAARGELADAAGAASASVTIWRQLAATHPEVSAYAEGAKQASTLLDEIKQLTPAADAAPSGQPNP
jgi:hypothetical protein